MPLGLESQFPEKQRTDCHARDQLLLDSVWWAQGLCIPWWALHSPLLSGTSSLSLSLLCLWSPRPLRPQRCLMTFQYPLSQFLGLPPHHTHFSFWHWSSAFSHLKPPYDWLFSHWWSQWLAWGGDSSSVPWSLVGAVVAALLGWEEKGKSEKDIGLIFSIPVQQLDLVHNWGIDLIVC